MTLLVSDQKLTLMPLNQLLAELKKDGYGPKNFTEAQLSMLMINMEILAVIESSSRYSLDVLNRIDKKVREVEKHLRIMRLGERKRGKQ
jgi:hypothetical protein